MLCNSSASYVPTTPTIQSRNSAVYPKLPEEVKALLRLNNVISESQAARLKIIKMHLSGCEITYSPSWTWRWVSILMPLIDGQRLPSASFFAGRAIVACKGFGWLNMLEIMKTFSVHEFGVECPVSSQAWMAWDTTHISCCRPDKIARKSWIRGQREWSHKTANDEFVEHFSDYTPSCAQAVISMP